MKKILVCLMMSCLLFGLMTSCGSTNSGKEFEEGVSAEEVKSDTDTSTEDETEESGYDDEEAEYEEQTDIAVYEETEAEITGTEITETDDGVQIIRVYFNFTNYSDKGLYMYESFVVKAFQNGKELTDITDINDDSESVNLIKEVKDGASIEGSYVFELTDDSEVEIRVMTPTADEEVLISETF